jgi:hypothetical protein
MMLTRYDRTIARSLVEPLASGTGSDRDYFSSRGEARWYTVERGSTMAIDPIGALELKTGTEGIGPLRPGDDLKVQPQLYTEDGLLIVTC